MGLGMRGPVVYDAVPAGERWGSRAGRRPALPRPGRRRHRRLSRTSGKGHGHLASLLRHWHDRHPAPARADIFFFSFMSVLETLLSCCGSLIFISEKVIDGAFTVLLRINLKYR